MGQPKHIVLIGGSVAGLGAALALTRDAHRVTILEADAMPLPRTAMEAFEKWDRRGSPQSRHSHVLLGRLHNYIRDFAPGLLQKLYDAGAETIAFRDIVSRDMPDTVPEPGDEDINLLACRRITFEYVLRRHVIESGLADFRDGMSVTGLLTDAAVEGEPLRVCGVRVQNADGSQGEIEADLVLDASGRRTQVGKWLTAAGGRAPRREQSSCGIFYSSRFYRLKPDAESVNSRGFQAGDLGYVKFGLFPGDGGLFSVTLGASTDDAPMRAVLRSPEAFERAVRAIPGCAEWIDPENAEPVTPVHGMANLNNTRNFWVENGEPVALGLLAIGDAHIHQNPTYGRGCALAWVGAFAVADALRAHPDDARALALATNEAVERDIIPWYEIGLRQDADAIAVAAAELRGEDPFAQTNPDGSANPKAFMRSMIREGLIPALRENAGLLRAFMRMTNLLDPPDELIQKPEILQVVLASYEKRHEREPIETGPPREAMLALLAEVS